MKLNKAQQILIGIGLILLTFVLTNYVILDDTKQAILSTKQRIGKLEADISLAKRYQESSAEIQEEMDQLKAQLERLKKILPVDINKPKFMADIKRYSNENGIEILAISRNKSTVDDVIVEHPFSYVARGNYHDFGRFFAQLSNYPRIINVKGLKIERKKDDQSYSVQTSFILSVFTYKEPTEEELRKQIEEKKQNKNNKGKRNS